MPQPDGGKTHHGTFRWRAALASAEGDHALTGTTMVTLLGTAAGDTAMCPGGSPVVLRPSGGCAVAASALGGLTPASSCLNNTAGTCHF